MILRLQNLATLKAFVSLLIKNNYTFMGSNLNNSNCFWISNDLIDLINIKPPNIDYLYEFTNCFCRESLGKGKKMTYLSEDLRLKEIENCNLIDLDSNSKIKDIFKI